jgi:hypothetical protein
MSEHGWPDFHDDGLHHHDDGGDDHHDALPDHQDELVPHEDGYFDDVHHDGDLPETHEVETPHEATPVWEEHQEIHDTVEHHDEVQEELHTVGADPDALPEPDAAEAVTSFPPLLDVGPLPEPVDGFPWIDTGSLGLIDPSVLHAAAQAQIHPQDLADYAGQELPPGQDPWAALADSDDPATSALAKWWSEQQQ